MILIIYIWITIIGEINYSLKYSLKCRRSKYNSIGGIAFNICGSRETTFLRNSSMSFSIHVDTRFNSSRVLHPNLIKEVSKKLISGSQLLRKAATSSTRCSDNLGTGTTAKAFGLPLKVRDDPCDVDGDVNGVPSRSGTSSLFWARAEGEVEARDEQELEVGGSKGATEIDSVEDEIAENLVTSEMLSANDDWDEAIRDGGKEGSQ